MELSYDQWIRLRTLKKTCTHEGPDLTIDSLCPWARLGVPGYCLAFNMLSWEPDKSNQINQSINQLNKQSINQSKTNQKRYYKDHI